MTEYISTNRDPYLESSASRRRSAIPSREQGIRTLRTLEDLQWLKGRAPSRRSPFAILELDGIPEDKSALLESRLNFYLHSCGCSQGAVLTVIAIAGSIFWQSAFYDWRLSSWPAFLLRMLVAAFLGAGIGKFAGLGFAKYQVRRIATRLATYVEDSQARGFDVDLHEMGR